MLRLWFNIWPFATMKISLIMIQICLSTPIIFQNKKNFQSFAKLEKFRQIWSHWPLVQLKREKDILKKSDWIEHNRCCAERIDHEMKIITLLLFRQLTVVNREMKKQKNSSFLSSPSSSQTNVVLINVIHIRWKKRRRRRRHLFSKEQWSWIV